MFVGHYAVGFVLKKRFKEIPLWLLFVSVQFVDILAFILVLLGIERMSYNPSENPFLRSIFEYIPFSHSLFTNIIIALVVFLIFWKLKNKAWGLALSIGVLSHWFIDFIAHTPDMPLFFNSYKVGLGLWNFPGIAFVLELLFLVVAGYYLYKGSNNIKRPLTLIVLLIIIYAPAFFAPEAEATATVASIVSLSLYAVFTSLAYWSERRIKVKG